MTSLWLVCVNEALNGNALPLVACVCAVTSVTSTAVVGDVGEESCPLQPIAKTHKPKTIDRMSLSIAECGRSPEGRTRTCEATLCATVDCVLRSRLEPPFIYIEWRRDRRSALPSWRANIRGPRGLSGTRPDRSTQAHFGPFFIDVHERVLTREGDPSLLPKAFDLLAALVAQPGRLVTKEDLLQTVWPDTFVEESNLAYDVFGCARRSVTRPSRSSSSRRNRSAVIGSQQRCSR